MITAIVQFKLSEPLTREKARESFLSSAPRFRKTKGLIRKYYLLSEDGGTAGGAYLWESREEAEQLYTDAWKGSIRSRYGAEPTVTYFESPVVVDNQLGKIIED